LIIVAKKEKRKPDDAAEPEVIGYYMSPLPKRRRRLRDFRSKGEDYIRSIYAYGREASLRAKLGCMGILAAAALIITLILYLVTRT
jgi:hypothetical protein